MHAAFAMEKTTTTTEWLHLQLSEIFRDIPDTLPLTDAEIDELAKLDSARHGVPHEV